MVFQENLIQLRKKANLSQEQLADKLSVTRQAISKWESGQAIPEADKIILLSAIFHVTTDQLLKGCSGLFPSNKLYFFFGNRNVRKKIISNLVVCSTHLFK